MLVPMTYRMFTQKEKQTTEFKDFPSWRVFSVTGFFTGIITSLSGLGGGILMVPVFSDFLKLPIKVATSISTGVIPIFTVVLCIPYMLAHPTIVYNYQLGFVVLPLVAPLILSVLFVSPFGVRIAQLMKPLQLRIIFACISSLIIIKEIYGLFF